MLLFRQFFRTPLSLKLNDVRQQALDRLQLALSLHLVGVDLDGGVEDLTGAGGRL
jgi:hypothetical protein